MPPRADILAQLQANGIDTGDATIAGYTDDQLFAMLKQLTGESFTQKMKQKFAAPPPPTPPANTDPNPKPAGNMSDDTVKNDLVEMSKKFSAFVDECKQRMGAVESAVQDVQKLKPDIQASAKFSQNYEETIKAERTRVVTAAVDAAIKTGRLLPTDKSIFVNAGVNAETVVKFSDGENKGKTEFEVWLADLENRPASYMFNDIIDDKQLAESELDAASRRVLEQHHRGRSILAGQTATA